METIYSNVEIEFKLLNGIVLMPATINDEQGYLIFDTGANTCLLGTALQNRFPVQPLEGALNVFTIASVSLQNRPYSNIVSVFTDISAIQNKVSVDGVIGYHILSSQRSYFDFSNQKLYLEEV